MKKSVLLVFIFALTACGASRQAAYSSAEIKNPCPEGGTCAIEMIKDKGLLLITDESGRPYYRLKEAPGRAVIKYTYTKDRNQNIADDGYTEEVVLETDAALTGLNATDSKLMFGVQCFCRGKAGYYSAKNAGMEFKNNTLCITLPDIVEGQRTKTIEAVFK